ncbi:hypothetical protein [Qipengyuania flava]|uniref:hypothetical protein n=1 Tax=Qipengyuania flava TaxID=192812 RepID=UPI001C638D6E|nr:hypothetical protein [Qipengyuania flava]QYJ08166.1 hypothetical protein KUV82_05550 [Qipengyuania flava]
MKSLPLFASSLLALGWSNALLAQESAQTPELSPEEQEEILSSPGTIVVSGQRIRGQLIVDQPPIAEYDEEDIAAFGGSSISDIIAAIEPATGSARGGRGGGRPIFLINGIRVSSFREFFRYPPESVAKVEVFAEEVAQRFGFSPDQRVVNIVLKESFGSLTLEVEAESPSRGGYWRNEQEVGYLSIQDGARINLNLDVEDVSLLTEDERGLSQPSAIPGVADEAPFRSLVSDSYEVEATANYAKAFIDSGSSISLNVTGTRSEELDLSGLRSIGGITEPIERRQRTDALTTAASYTRPLGDFRLTATFDGGRTRTRTEIDRNAASGFDTARSTVWNATSLATVRGIALEIPAGEIATTFDFGYDWRRIESEDTRTLVPTDLTRGDLSAGVNIVVPLTSRRTGFLEAVGDLSITGQAGINHLSDFGTLQDWTLGLNWSPFESLNLQATRIWREVAPGLSALGAPRVDRFNVPVFDFASGQDVLATVVSGGNPALVRETQSDWKFGANWELPFWDGARLQTDYAINRSRDVTLSSPAFTSAFEQAFPGRVSRDGAGNLLAIDQRPVTLFETRSRTLSFGLSTRGRLGGGSRGGEQARGGRPGGAGGQGFDPERFARMREQFCSASTTNTPDISGLPERMRARLVDENGNPDPERIAAARQRLCSADGAPNEDRRAAMRAALCANPPQIDQLPPPMQARLRGEDGEIDQERLAQARARMCSDGGAGAPQQGARPGAGSGGPPMMNPFARRGGGGGRYFLNLNHTIALENEVVLSAGGPVFDQLDGFVIGSGAIPKHSTRLEAGLFMDGYGVRLSGRYLGEAVLRGSGVPGSSDLFFGDLVTFDIRVFANLGQVLDRNEGFLKGFRVAFVLDNVFDGQRRVVDATGAVPDAYDPRRIDPVGRYIGIDLRKMF